MRKYTELKIVLAVVVMLAGMGVSKALNKPKYEQFYSANDYYQYIRQDLDAKETEELEWYLYEAIELREDLEDKKDNIQYELPYNRTLKSIKALEKAIDRRG